MVLHLLSKTVVAWRHTTLQAWIQLVFSGTALGGLSLATIYYVKDITVVQPANLTQFYTTFTVSSTVGGGEVNLSSATGTMKAVGSTTTILEITGQDFTLGGSGLANLNLTTARIQPKQRYAIDIEDACGESPAAPLVFVIILWERATRNDAWRSSRRGGLRRYLRESRGSSS